jgi:hypothetical protein
MISLEIWNYLIVKLKFQIKILEKEIKIKIYCNYNGGIKQ